MAILFYIGIMLVAFGAIERFLRLTEIDPLRPYRSRNKWLRRLKAAVLAFLSVGSVSAVASGTAVSRPLALAMVWLMVGTAVVSPIVVDRKPGDSWLAHQFEKAKNALSGTALLKIVGAVVALVASFFAPHNWYLILLLASLWILIGRAHVAYESSRNLPPHYDSTERALLARHFRAVTIGGVLAFLLWWMLFAVQYQIHGIAPESWRDFLGVGFGAVLGVAHATVTADAA